MSSGARGRNVLKHAQEERSTVFVFVTLHSHQMEGEIAVDWEELMRLEIVKRRVAQVKCLLFVCFTSCCCRLLQDVRNDYFRSFVLSHLFPPFLSF